MGGVLLIGAIVLIGRTVLARPDAGQAEAACRDFVGAALAVAGSAEYGAPTSEALGAGKWLVHGTVSALDPTGERLHMRYDCRVASAGGHWSLEELTGLDPGVMWTPSAPPS